MADEIQDNNIPLPPPKKKKGDVQLKTDNGIPLPPPKKKSTGVSPPSDIPSTSPSTDQVDPFAELRALGSSEPIENAQPVPESFIPSKQDQFTGQDETYIEPIKQLTSTGAPIDTPKQQTIAPQVTKDLEATAISRIQGKQDAETKALRNADQKIVDQIKGFDQEKLMADGKGIVTNREQYFNLISDDLANRYLADADRDEYKYVKGITTLENQLEAEKDRLYRIKDAGGQVDVEGSLVPFRAKLLQAQDEYNRYKTDKFSTIDKTIEAFKKSREMSSNKEYWDQQIKDAEAQKQNFFKSDTERLNETYKANKADIDKFQIPGATPKERLRNLYLIQNQRKNDLLNEIMPDGNDGILRGMALNAGDLFGAADLLGLSSYEDREKLKKYYEIDKQLKSLAPVVLINRNPVKSDDGFFDVFGKKAIEGIFPAAKTLTSQDVSSRLNAALAISGVSPSDIERSNLEKTERIAQPYEAFSAKDWASMAAPTIDMLPYFVVGGGITGALGKAIGLSSKGAKVLTALNSSKLGRFIYGGVKAGLSYEAAGQLAPAGSSVQDEGSFWSGFLGNSFSKALGATYNNKFAKSLFDKAFGNNAPKAMNIVESIGKKVGQGLGETAEEYGNEIGNLVDLYNQSGNWEEVKKQLGDRFGTLDKNVRFTVQTMIMGMMFGQSTEMGRNMFANSKDMYAKLGESDKAVVDSFVEEVNSEVKEAEKKVYKEEEKVANETEAQKPAEPVTPEQQEKYDTALQTIKNPNSSAEDQLAAAREIKTIQDVARESAIKNEVSKEAVPEQQTTVTTESVSPEVPSETTTSEQQPETMPVSEGIQTSEAINSEQPINSEPINNEINQKRRQDNQEGLLTTQEDTGKTPVSPVVETAIKLEDVYYELVSKKNRGQANLFVNELLDKLPAEEINNPETNGFLSQVGEQAYNQFKKNGNLDKLVSRYVELNREKLISEAYHKAKADGTNPDLVTAVEDAIGKIPESTIDVKPVSKHKAVKTAKDSDNPFSNTVVKPNPESNVLSYSREEENNGYANISDLENNDPQITTEEFVRGMTGVNPSGTGISKYFNTHKKIDGKDVAIRVSNHPHVSGNTVDNRYTVSVVVNGGDKEGVSEGEDFKEIRINATPKNIEDKILQIREEINYISEDRQEKDAKSKKQPDTKSEIPEKPKKENKPTEAAVPEDIPYQKEALKMSKSEFTDRLADKFDSKEDAQQAWEFAREAVFAGKVAKVKNDISNEIRNSRNTLSANPVGNFKVLAKVAELMGLYYQRGVTKFSDFAKATGLKANEKLKQLWNKITGRGKISNIAPGTKIKSLNSRVLYDAALAQIPKDTADAQAKIDALQDMIHTLDVLKIHSLPESQQDVQDARNALASLYQELSADLEKVNERIKNKSELSDKNIDSYDKGVDYVFKKSPELSSVGTPQEYSEYVNSLFPDSKVKNIVYHGTMKNTVPTDKFKGYVTYFTDNINYAETFGFVVDREIVTSILNLEKPYYAKSELYDVPQEIHDKGDYTNPRIIKQENNGYDSVIGTDAGQKSGKTYVVFDPDNIHILGSKSDIKQFKKWKNGNPTTGINISERLNNEIELGQKMFDLSDKLNLVEKGLLNLEDDFLWQKKAQKQIEHLKGTVADNQNPYLQRDIEVGKIRNRVDKVYQKIFGKSYGDLATNKKGDTSLLKDMSKDGLTQSDLDLFMYAQHAKERNERVRKLHDIDIQAQIQDKTAQLNQYSSQDTLTSSDKAQVTRLTNAINDLLKVEIPQEGSGMSDAKADELLAEFDKAGKTEKLTQYAQQFRDIVIKPAIDAMEEGGLITTEEAEMLRNGESPSTGVKFEYYVPLKVNSGMLADVKGSSVPTVANPIKRLSGTDKYDYIKRNSPFAQALLDFKGAVKAAEDNKTAQSLYRLVKDNPNPRVWDIEPAKYDIKLDNEGKAISTTELTSQEIRDNSVPVKIEGKKYYVHLKHEGLLKAWKATRKDPPEFIRFISNLFRTFNNFKRTILTQLNPVFGFKNLTRDVQDAVFNASSLNIPGAGRKVVKALPKIQASLVKATLGNLDPESEYGKLLDEYLANGGKVSWLDYDKIENEEKNIRQLSAKYNNPSKVSKAIKNPFKYAVQSVGAVNEAIEIGTRLAVYKTVREAGYSAEKAAGISKNLSINFNKRGTATPYINMAYLFSNAGIQANITGMRHVLTSRKTRRYAAQAAILGLGYTYLSAFLADIMSKDDDEKEFYDKLITQGEKEGTIYLPIGNKQVITIPKSYGVLRTFFNMGEETGNVLHGKNTMSAIGDWLGTAGALIDPIGGGTPNKLSAYTPTLFRGFVEVADNKTWNNQPIYPDQRPFSIPDPDNQRYFKNVGEHFKDAAKFMYDKSGKSVDVSPETLEYIFNDFTGGIIKELKNTGGVVDDLVAGKKVDRNKIPFYSTFVKDLSKEDWRYKKAYYEIFNRAATDILTEAELNELKRYGRLMGKQPKYLSKDIKAVMNAQKKLKEQSTQDQ